VWFKRHWANWQTFPIPECQDIAYESEHYDTYMLEEGEVQGQLYNNVTLFALSHGEGRCNTCAECALGIVTRGMRIHVKGFTGGEFSEAAAGESTCLAHLQGHFVTI
jgi:predicted metal-binding protein